MDLAKLQPPIERQLALLGYELVCLETVQEGRDTVLRLYIEHADHNQAVTLDDCEAVNRGLLPWMDVEFPSLRESLSLEISSPGLDRPLVKPEHFRRFAGRLCRIQARVPVNGQKRFKGWILDATEEAVSLEEDGILKSVPLASIQRARLAPFEEDRAPKSKLAAPGRAASHNSTEDPGVETSAGEEE